MNATPASDGRPDTYERAACGTQTPLVAGADAVPRQKGGARETERLHGATADLLEHPAVHTAAQAAAVENLLRCWVRENNLAAPTDGTLRIPLPASGASLLTPVHYWSPTGWHRFGLPHLADAPDGAPPADAVTVAALLARQAATDLGTTSTAVVTSTPVAESGPGGDGADLVGRVADSVRRTVVFINDRRQRPADTPDLFLAAEQALVLGHPWHPTPKSREGLSEAEARLYSPELRGSFPLHWMAVAPSVLAAESAWTERGRPVPAQLLTARLAGAGLPCPTVTPPCRCTPGRWPRSGTAPRPRPCSTPDCSGTSARTAPPGTPPPPSAPSTAPAPPRCSSCRWACASPTPAGRTSARSSTAAWRSTVCCAAACPSSGSRPTRASTSSAIPPGSRSTPRTAPH